MNLKNRNFLKLLDYTPEEMEHLLSLAAELKAKKKAGIPHKLCEGKNIALIFEKTSTRTRCAFEVAIKPDLAIVFEGSPADDFYFSAGLAQCTLHKGVQIRHLDVSYLGNPVFMKKAHEIGGKYGIPYQDTVRRGGGTNAGKISLEGKAVPVLVLGIPSRYVHTPSNFCALEDIDAAIRMAVELIKAMDQTMIDEILRKDLLGRLHEKSTD